MYIYIYLCMICVCIYIYIMISTKNNASAEVSLLSLSPSSKPRVFSACKLPFIAAASLTMLFQPQQGEIYPITRVVPISTYGWNSHKHFTTSNNMWLFHLWLDICDIVDIHLWLEQSLHVYPILEPVTTCYSPILWSQLCFPYISTGDSAGV